MKTNVETPEDANNRLVLCGCTIWCELEMDDARDGWVKFSGVCDGCGRAMRLDVRATPEEGT